MSRNLCSFKKCTNSAHKVKGMRMFTFQNYQSYSGNGTTAVVSKCKGSVMSFLCSTCGKLFSSNSVYELHINTHEEAKKFICGLCKKKFILEHYLQEHIIKAHSSKFKKKTSSMSPLCSEVIASRTMMEKHSPEIEKTETSSLVKCTDCYKFILKRNLKRHIIQKHDSTLNGKNKGSERKCIVCKKVVLTNLKRHMIRNHSPIVDDERKFKCSICSNKKYSLQTSLNRHMKNVHEVSTPASMKCPLCKQSFVKVPKNNPKSIYNHFETKHEIPMKYESYHFFSINEFNNWKSSIEKETISRFVIHLKKSDQLIFKCHRSGKYRSKGCVQRNLKAIGSCKIDGFCPASVKANIVNDNEIHVTYQKTHVGHENELRYISLTAEERKSIAVQLANKVTHDEILKGIQSSLTDSPLQRIHLTSKKDIYNIKRSCILSAEAAKYSSNQFSEEKCFLKFEPIEFIQIESV